MSLGQTPKNKNLKTLAAIMLFAPHISTIELFFKRCSEHRGVLGSHFVELQNLIFELSNIFDRIKYANQHSFGLNSSDKNFEKFIKEFRSKSIR